LADVRALEPVDGAVEEDVLAAREVRMEPGAELEQRSDPPAGLGLPRARLDDPRKHAQERRLPGAVAADETDGAAGLDAERDVPQRDDLLRARPSQSDEHVLQPS